MYRDYSPKGVKFFFVYKSLAHPELAGDYVQPFTLEERLAHARQAAKQLGASIPWLVDAMDNRLKHAMGDRPNSEFIINPKGIIVRKRAWSHPIQLRKDLEELVGKVEKITREEDVTLNVQLPPKPSALRGVVERITRARMQAIEMEPVIDSKGHPFYAKLRAEADADLLRDGAGKLYLGFHLDPFHGAHWNNLTAPLAYKLKLPEDAKVEKVAGKAAKVAAASDADPREFLLDVEAWPADKPIRLTVTYSACVEESCHVIQQDYILYLKRDRDGGGARGAGAGLWGAEFVNQQLARDKDGDGKLNSKEVMGLIAPHFAHFDVDKDGLLDAKELHAVVTWLNTHHAPGQPKPAPPGAVVPRLPEGVTPEKLGDPKEAAKVAEWLEKEYPEPQPESVKMLVAILRGSQLNGRDGWFGPAESRYSWKWLAERHKLEPTAKALAVKDFRGPAALADVLDRDGDGDITPADLDWSDRSPYAMQLNHVSRVFRRIDMPTGDGKLTRDDLDTFFKMAAKGKDHLTVEDFRRIMVPRGGFSPGDAPKVPVLVKGLFGGEIGSMGEGPKVGDRAPDFTLKTPDGKDTVSLAKLTGKKPVVLVFGNFTCGPFRSLFPEVDAVYQRYKDDANFVMVYVREA
ncbi:MAG TPA: deiodinase family protein, partial [Gemmata sp.]|nr:deiodinase family protein [Gemmata sp.]